MHFITSMLKIAFFSIQQTNQRISAHSKKKGATEQRPNACCFEFDPVRRYYKGNLFYEMRFMKIADSIQSKHSLLSIVGSLLNIELSAVYQQLHLYAPRRLSVWFSLSRLLTRQICDSIRFDLTLKAGVLLFSTDNLFWIFFKVFFRFCFNFVRFFLDFFLNFFLFFSRCYQVDEVQKIFLTCLIFLMSKMFSTSRRMTLVFVYSLSTILICVKNVLKICYICLLNWYCILN